MKPVLRFVLIVLALLSQIQRTQAEQMITLADGTYINIVSVQSDATLSVQYRTALPLEDKSALRIQADAVWDHFASQIKPNTDSVVLSALTADGQYDFSLQKQNGNWRSVDFKSGEIARLTNDIVKQIMSGADAAMVQHESNATLLYLDDNWTVTENYKKNNTPVSQTTSRAEIIGKMTSDMTQNYKHSRNIYNIAISDDGQTAKVESYEDESGVIKGRSFIATEQSSDNMAIAGKSIVFTKSQSALNAQILADTTSTSKGSNAEGFKSGLFAQLIPLGIIYTPISLIMVFLSYRKVQMLKALQLSGIQTLGIITAYKTYKAGNNYQTMMDTMRTIQKMKNEGADKEAISKSLRDHTIQQTVRRGLSIRYTFQTAMGSAQNGRIKIMGWRVPNQEKYAVNSNVDVVYLERKPSKNFIKDLLEAGTDQTSASLRRVLWSLLFITVIDAADVMAYLNVF